MHYAILVIGDDVEGQMEPYNEQREVTPYREDVNKLDIDTAVRFYQERRWLEWNNPPKKDFADQYEAEYLKAKAAKFDPTACYLLYCNDEIIHEDENGLYRMSTYNPEGKWDYWRIGGRYCRRLLLKPGASGHSEDLSWEWTFNKEHGGNGEDPEPPPEGVDQAKKGDIDFDRMSAERVAKAEEAWAKFTEITDALGPLIVINFSTASKEERDAFFAAPVVKAMGEAELVGWNGFYEWTDFSMTYEQFIEKERLNGMLPFYGYVHEGKWFEKETWNRGAKTWDENVEYYRQGVDLLISLPDDTLLTVLDIHS